MINLCRSSPPLSEVIKEHINGIKCIEGDDFAVEWIAGNVDELSTEEAANLKICDMFAISSLPHALVLAYFKQLLGLDDKAAASKFSSCNSISKIYTEQDQKMGRKIMRMCANQVKLWRKSPVGTKKPKEKEGCDCFDCQEHLRERAPKEATPQALGRAQAHQRKLRDQRHTPSGKKKKTQKKRSTAEAALDLDGIDPKLGIDSTAAKQLLAQAGGGDRLHRLMLRKLVVQERRAEALEGAVEQVRTIAEEAITGVEQKAQAAAQHADRAFSRATAAQQFAQKQTLEAREYAEMHRKHAVLCLRGSRGSRALCAKQTRYAPRSVWCVRVLSRRDRSAR